MEEDNQEIPMVMQDTDSEPDSDFDEDVGMQIFNDLHYHHEMFLQEQVPSEIPVPETRMEDAPASERFDTDLPLEHSYLGNLERVSGVDCLEAGKSYKIPLFVHHSLVFPGEQFPMMIPSKVYENAENAKFHHEDGCLFGLVFPNVRLNNLPCGVTCQIYEKGDYKKSNIITIKSKAYQRFVIDQQACEIMMRQNQQKCFYGTVTIQPEIVLRDPVYAGNTNSLSKYRDIMTSASSKQKRYRKIEASSLPWPNFVYEQYNVENTIEKLKKHLTKQQIETMPMDPILRSFWCAKNMLLNAVDKRDVFCTNFVIKRMLIIDKSLDQEKFFSCRTCSRRLAHYKSLFAMSKEGLQSNYCNPAGYIHETNTVYSILSNSMYVNSPPSTEFSWFPGYAWRIACCSGCRSAIGWRFETDSEHLVPKQFYGLSGTNIKVERENKFHNCLSNDVD